MNFHIDDDSLTIEFEAAEQFWALKRQLVLPKANITSLTWEEEWSIPRKELGLRMGGSAIPGGVFAGRFWGGGVKNFLYVQHTRGMFGKIRMPHVLIITLKKYPYHRMLFTVDDPDMAEQIVNWWSSRG